MPENAEHGALTEAVYYILLAAYSEPIHGYGMMQSIGRLSKGRVNLGPGTLYGALKTLLEKGWLADSPGASGSRQKAYRITEEGRSALQRERKRLKELLRAGKEIIQGRGKRGKEFRE